MDKENWYEQENCIVCGADPSYFLTDLASPPFLLVLKTTGRGEIMKSGNLAAPITSLPHQKEDGPFEKPGWTGEVKEPKLEGDLAKPITALPHSGDSNLAFQKPEWTKQNSLKGTKKGEALKTGKEIARPIGGIRQVED